jgi:hypothetical protein
MFLIIWLGSQWRIGAHPAPTLGIGAHANSMRADAPLGAFGASGRIRQCVKPMRRLRQGGASGKERMRQVAHPAMRRCAKWRIRQ